MLPERHLAVDDKLCQTQCLSARSDSISSIFVVHGGSGTGRPEDRHHASAQPQLPPEFLSLSDVTRRASRASAPTDRPTACFIQRSLSVLQQMLSPAGTCEIRRQIFDTRRRAKSWSTDRPADCGGRRNFARRTGCSNQSHHRAVGAL